MLKREMECGCEILIYEDGSAAPEIVYCRLHASAQGLVDALTEICESVEARAAQHSCMGFHCSKCTPALTAEVARKALEIAGVKEEA